MLPRKCQDSVHNGVNSLEHRILILMEFYHLDQSIVETRSTFQRLFNNTKRPNRISWKIHNGLQNINDGFDRNVGRLGAEDTEANL